MLADPLVLGSVCNKLYRRDIIGNTQFNCDLNYCEDADFNIRIAKNNSGAAIHYINKILYYYHLDTVSITRDGSGPRQYYQALGHFSECELFRSSARAALYRAASIHSPDLLNEIGVSPADYFLCSDVPLAERLKHLIKLLRKV